MRRVFVRFLVAAMLVVPTAGRADAQSDQREIDRQVWIPFLEASSAYDADRFLALHSPHFVRVAPDVRETQTLQPYGAGIREGFARARSRGLARRSEMRFLSRISSGDAAFETGYFRSRTTMPDGSVRERYSRFEIVLRREDGRWRILIDKDSADGGAITAAMFEAATPLTSFD